MDQTPSGVNRDYYNSGRIQARYYGATPKMPEPVVGSADWWANEGVKDVAMGKPSRTGVEPMLTDNAGQPIYPGQRPTQPPVPGPIRIAPPVNGGGVRTLPVYTPWPGVGPGSGVFVPPPTAVVKTYEVFGRRKGRRVGWHEISRLVRGTYQIDRDSQVLVTDNPHEGFGLAGTPGSWPNLYPNTSPANYGLDPRYPVVGFDQAAHRGVAVGNTDLVELFGADWQRKLYH